MKRHAPRHNSRHATGADPEGDPSASSALIGAPAFGGASRRDWVTPLNPFILLYSIFTATAYVVSPIPEHSLRYLIHAGTGVAVFWVTYVWLDRPTRMRQLLKVLVLAGGLLALGGLFLVAWPARPPLDRQPFLERLPHLPVTFSIHPNAMAGALLPPLCLAWGVWHFDMPRRQRLLLVVSVSLMGIVLLFTQSRNAWLALPVAWLTFRLWGRSRFALPAIVLGMSVALPFAVNLLPDGSLPYLERVVARVDTFTKSGETDDPSWLSRLEIWRVACQTLVDYPAVGAGLYAFEVVSRANYVYTVVSPRLPLTHAHNLFWQTALNLGVFGLLTLLGLWCVMLRGLWQQPLQAGRYGAVEAAMLGTAFVGYTWFNLFDLVAFEMRAGIFIWLYLAAAARLIPSRPRIPVRAVVAVLVVWLVMLLSPLGRQSWHRLRLDAARLAPTGPDAIQHSITPAAFSGDARRQGLAHLVRGEVDSALDAWVADEEGGQFLRQQGIVAYYDGAWERAAEWLNFALQLDDTDGLTHYWLGLAYQALQNPERACRHFDLALAAIGEVGPPTLLAEVWEERGRVLAQLAEWEGAADSFARAAALFPDNADYAQQLHQVNLLLQGADGDTAGTGLPDFGLRPSGGRPR